MSRDISSYISYEDVARSLIGDVEIKNGETRFNGHVIGFPERQFFLGPGEEHIEAILSRPAINSFIEDGTVRQSILSFGVLNGFQIGRLYLKNTIKSVFLRPYKFISITIVPSDEKQIYCADQSDRAHFAIGLGGQAFEKLAELVRRKQMCSVHIPVRIWRGPSLNYFAMETGGKDYSGNITTSAYDEESLDFGLNELTQAAYGA